jgi:hypothetical protein
MHLTPAGSGRRSSKKRWLWHALGEPGSLGELERLPWRMWRRLFRMNPSRFLQNISSSLSRIIGIPPPVSWNDAKPQAPGMTHSHKEDDPAEEYTTCYVEEEFPGNTEEKANSTSGEPPEEAAQQDKQQGQQGGSANEDKERPMHRSQFPSPPLRENGRTSLHSSTRSTWN